MSRFLQQQYPKLALNIMPNFPDLGIINLYAHPQTLEGNGGLSWLQPAMARGPNIAALATFACQHFNWTEGAKLVQQFGTTIFPGLAMHELVHTACLLDRQALRHPVILPLIGNVIAYWSHTLAGGIKEACIELHVPAANLAKLYKIAGNLDLSTKFHRFCVWVSVPVLFHVLPDAIELGPEWSDTNEDPSGDATQCMCHSCLCSFSPCSCHDMQAHEVIKITSSPKPASPRIHGEHSMMPHRSWTDIGIYLVPAKKSYKTRTYTTAEGREIIELETDDEGGI